MRWLREPLVHFLAVGAALFVLFALVGGSDEGRTDRIVVSGAKVEQLAQIFVKTWQRPPSQAELAGLIDDHVREEILYREAMAMGLDRDDTIVRRRLRQKLEFFSDDMVAALEPGDDELGAYLAKNPEKFQAPTRLSFEQIYLNPEERGEAAMADAHQLRVRLASLGRRATAELGDRLMLPREFSDEPADQIDRRFGTGFSDQLAELPIGEWAGPVESGYGLHLVYLSERRPGVMPELEEVREAVEREWRNERRLEAKEAFYRSLRERYEVTVETPEMVEEAVLNGASNG